MGAGDDKAAVDLNRPAGGTRPDRVLWQREADERKEVKKTEVIMKVDPARESVARGYRRSYYLV